MSREGWAQELTEAFADIGALWHPDSCETMNPTPFQTVFHKYIASFSGSSQQNAQEFWGSSCNGEATGHHQSQPVVQFPLHLSGEGSAWRTWIKWWWLSQLKCGSAPWNEKTARLQAYLWDSWIFASRARPVGITPSKFSVTCLCPSPRKDLLGQSVAEGVSAFSPRKKTQRQD